MLNSKNTQALKPKAAKDKISAFNIFRFLGPGVLIAVGFIDPGNWATNIAAGSEFGYSLLWMVTLSTIMLVILQHNASRLGIATGKCLAESSAFYLPSWLNLMILSTALIAAVATGLAEILGAGIALEILFGINLNLAVFLVFIGVCLILFYFSYCKIEKIIIVFVFLIVIAFLIELFLVKVDWVAASKSWVNPSLPPHSLLVIMGVLGAVVMPHNLFLHSEIIQSRSSADPHNLNVKHHSKNAFIDTTVSMLIGWAINSAIIILAAATFYTIGKPVDDIRESAQLLKPLLGNLAVVLFAVAFLFAGFSSSITAGFAGGSIFAGMFKKAYDASKPVTRSGILITLFLGTILILFIKDPFKGLVYSQVLLSIQLPITVFLQIYLTSSKKVMGPHANKWYISLLLWLIALTTTVLNICLLYGIFTGTA